MQQAAGGVQGLIAAAAAAASALVIWMLMQLLAQQLLLETNKPVTSAVQQPSADGLQNTVKACKQLQMTG